MPSYIVKHGCCYIPPVDSDPDVTCEVYANPDFRRVTTSDALCGSAKSSPEFTSPRKQNRMSSNNLNGDCKGNKLQAKLEQCVNADGIELSIINTHRLHSTSVTHDGKPHDNTSFVTIYGNRLGYDKCDSAHSAVSDCSVYRPTTKHVPTDQLSSSEKFLDCLSICFWKCSSWCQKVD